MASFGELNSFARYNQGQLCTADSSIKEILLQTWIKKKVLSKAKSISLRVKAIGSAPRAGSITEPAREAGGSRTCAVISPVSR